MAKSLTIVTHYGVGNYHLQSEQRTEWRGAVWFCTRVPYWKQYPSNSYRVWNYVWGEDPDV